MRPKAGWKRTAVFVCLMIAACGGEAAPKSTFDVTVQQLTAIVASGRSAHDSDEALAQKIAGVTLSERLTDATLAALLEKTPGPETTQELRIQADKSAFLQPPAAELPQAPKPAMSEQRLMIARAINYTAGFIANLPDFICTRTVRRLDDNPLLPSKKSERWQGIWSRDTLVQQLTFNHGKESSTFQMVNGHVYRGKREMNGLMTTGEFGNMLAMMLIGKTGLKAWWNRWENVDGKRLAVFRYYVDQAHSQYAISYCCHQIKDSYGRIIPATIVAAFGGELFFDPASGVIYRVTWRTLHLPEGYPTKESSTLVEYRRVYIGGNPYVLPARSLTVSDSLVYPNQGPTTYPLHSINESKFSEYRKFDTDATLLADGSSHHAKAQPAPPVQVMTPEVVAQPGETFDPSEDSDKGVPAAAPKEVPPAITAGNAPALTEVADASPSPMFSLPVAPPFIPPTVSPTVFKTHLTEVTVPVVVRDGKGHVVEDLGRDDFVLFENGKRVQITEFAVERAATKEEEKTAARQAAAALSEDKAVRPDRFVSYLFDDLHLSAVDLQQARKAAKQALEKATDEQSRAAVFTTSGIVATHFTNDHQELEQAWNHIAPRARTAGCPDIPPFVADRIINNNDGAALATEMAALEACQPMPQEPMPKGMTIPDTMQPHTGPQLDSEVGIVKGMAQRVLNENDATNMQLLGVLRTMVRKMAILAGQRTIVLISPGFMTPYLSSEVNGLIDEAARDGVVVNAVDARGLYTLAGYDAENKGMSDAAMQTRSLRYQAQEQQLQSNIMVQLAAGTGGTLFENSNDLRNGIQRATARPEVRYVLGFTPAEGKIDGSFHRLKVEVPERRGLTLEARRGYLTPKRFKDPAEQAKQDLLEAVFSRDRLNDLPTTLQTQLEGNGLTVLTHMDIRSMAFEKAAGVNHDVVTAVVSLFDADGRYVKGLQDQLKLDFPDATLDARLASGVSFKNEFNGLSTGDYLVRVVLRDAQGQMASSEQAVAVQ